MPKTRVLIVDDSVVVRRLLTDVLTSDPSCEVVGAAPNGRLALTRIPQLNPDLITLDVEMPEMDGLETLAAIRKIYPRLPVIMFSGLTLRAADATLRALALGATDYVTKPTAASGVSAADQIREQLIPKIRWLRGTQGGLGLTPRPVATVPSRATVTPLRSQAPVRGPARVDIVAIGCSTGGPNALAALLPKLAAAFPVPIVITQHMPPLFTRLLAERMDAACPLTVHEASGGEKLERGHVYFAPGDFHLEVQLVGAEARLGLTQAPPENSCRPAVDVMMRSVVSVYGSGTLGVILTGMGQDGLRGCELIREAGGQVIIQDEASSVVWGMPGAVARAGLADAVVPLDGVATEIVRRVGGASRTPPVAARAARVG